MAAKQESNYNTQQAGTVKHCQRFLPICRAKSENKVKKCRPRSVSGTRVRSVLLTGYPALEALSSAKNPPAAGVLPAGVYRPFPPPACLCYHGTKSAKERGLET